MEEIMKYTYTIRKGIDDLKSLYAFSYVDQGGVHRTNSIKEYFDSEGWLNYDFKCEMTPKAIAHEIEQRDLWNKNYIRELRRDGEYGKEEEGYIEMDFNPLLDAALDKPIGKTIPLCSYRLVYLEL